MNNEAIRNALRVTKAVADLQRLRILRLLQAGELCVCQIVEVLELAPSTVSKHLSILVAAGLVDWRKDGRWMYYRLPERADGAFVRPVLRWLNETLKNDATTARDARKLKSVLVSAPETLCRRQRQRNE
ncbi:MAG TPA: metalloregulator ArsR/SmtB family transcription factor [Anaerolineae bacterium]|nr:metalloregulator ArsR/SmtB family transcription factor [Anaerolineae bacterium]